MEIRTLQKNDLESLIMFNRRVYPEKKIDMSEYIKFWVSQSENECEETVVILNDDGQIVGQSFFSSMSYFFNNEEVRSLWGFDLIVDEKYRKDNWGVDLMLKSKKVHPISFATGSGPDALKMNLKLGQKLLGCIKKYVGVVNPLWLPFSALGKKVDIDSFPSSVYANGNIFQKLLDPLFLPDINQPYNKNLFEISRNIVFLRWRFFNNLHKYAFYFSKESGNWFVMRVTVIHHLTVLILLDWRCDINNKQEYETIYKAAKVIANKIRVPILITGSSLDVFDKILESHGMKQIGRPRPIIGKVPVKDYVEEIKHRNFIFATLADSDGETNWP